MTKHEGAILTAYTGRLLTDFQTFHEYAEKILGRPVFTHEFAEQKVTAELQEKSKEDFVKLMESLS